MSVAMDGFQHRDVSLGALFYARDGEWLREQVCRKRNLDNFIALMDETLRRKGADRGRNGGYRMPRADRRRMLRQEPLAIAKKVDLVVNKGMEEIAKWATGGPATSFTHQAAGTGTTSETAGANALEAELARVALDTSGSRFPSGTSMKFAGFYDESTPTGAYREFGNVNAAAGGSFLNIVVIDAADVINHASGSTVFAFTSIVNQAAS